MRSYETARSLFSFLAFCAWSTVGVGVIAAFVGAGSVSRYGDSGAAFLAMMPGIGISLIALFQVAVIQNARATVDTAEYTQQMLKISRDQLQVSEQALKQGDAFQKSYAALNKETNDAPQSMGYAAQATKSEKAASSPKSPISNYGKRTSYNGHAISESNGIFSVENAAFRHIEHAKEHIDMLREKGEMMAKIAELSAVAIPKLDTVVNQSVPAPEPIQLRAPITNEKDQEADTDLIKYNGKIIEPSGDKFTCNGIPFNTLKAAKNYIDNFATVPPKTLPGVQRP